MRPLPLSPRSANACPRPSPFSVSNDTKREVPFSNRSIKQVPIPQSRDATRDRRRNLFLKKVQKDREDGRWESRSEQILKSDYVSQRRQWEAEQARRALDYYEPIEEDEEDDPMITSQEEYQLPRQNGSSVQEELDAELEWAARQDDEFYDYLLERTHEPQRQPASLNGRQLEHCVENFGSDDDDYDTLLLEAFNSCEAPQPSQQSENPSNDTFPRADTNDTDMMDG
ncbi:hypothetical protein LTS18_005493 [Coniosporium uncinatum]|uniref:Uncharacterized protein n=1 Tax=Coniosporium uncinatum TaxID=93489 RepID=A0ACC3D4V0_9PEZI|nr:hypothetical protein LTS18_005493 [Coniosporium uncinatum]